MTSIQPELWVDRAAAAVAFYQAAFDAAVLHLVGEGEDIVAQLAVADAAFWVASTGSTTGRFSPRSIGGATSRMLLVVDEPGRGAPDRSTTVNHGTTSNEENHAEGVTDSPDPTPLRDRINRVERT